MRLQKNSYIIPLARYPAVRIVLLYTAGILCAHYIKISLFIVTALLAILLITHLLLQSLFNKTLNSRWIFPSISVFLLSIFMFGIFRLRLSNKSPEPGKRIGRLSPDSVLVSGQILSVRHNSYSDEYTALINHIAKNNVFHTSLKFKMLLRQHRDLHNTFLSQGDQVKALINIIPIPGKQNPNEFDYKSWLTSKHIYTEGNIIHILTKKPIHNKWTWLWWRKHIEQIINRNFSAKNAAVAKAILLGQKQDVRTTDKQAFIHAGLAHLMAVSGLHVGFIVAPFWFLIPYFWTKKYGKIAGLIILSMILFLYAGLTGFTASVIRASLTAFLLSVGRLYQKVHEPINLTAAAALIILLFNPNALFSVSFQLSFGAVFTILLLFPVVSHFVPERIKHRWYSGIIDVVLLSITVQVGLFPLLVYYFHQFSIVAPISNIVAIPMTQVIVLWSIPCIFIGSISTSFGILLNTPADKLLGLLTKFATWAGSFPWSWFHAHLFSKFIFLIWIAAIFLISSLFIPRLRWKWLTVLFFVISVYHINHIIEKSYPPKLKITVFDVGDGNAVLIQTPHHKNILIDTGIWHINSNSGKNVLLPDFRIRGIHRLDAVILMYPHADRIGGMATLINHIPMDTIFNSGFDYNSNLFHRYLAEAHSHNIPVKALKSGDILRTDPSVRLFILAPDTRIQNDHSKPKSVVLKVVYGRTSFLFAGDSDKKADKHLETLFGHFLHSGFLKVAHHGSNSGTTIPFLKLIQPNTAAISVKIPNRYHYPDKPVVNMLVSSGIRVHYTGLEKALVFTSDGLKIRQKHWK